MNEKNLTTVILLAGGVGNRMQSHIPKQFLELNGKPIAWYSFQLFLNMPEIDEIVIVCLEDFRKNFKHQSLKPVHFALPGNRRQDSVFNGFQKASGDFLCIHDTARPFISKELVINVLNEGFIHGAAALGVPIKFTVKQSDSESFVTKTLDRSCLWEIQTPQVIKKEIFKAGFDYAHQHALHVTDDVSLAELIGKKVKLVEGSYNNLKITVPMDLIIANQMMKEL